MLPETLKIRCMNENHLLFFWNMFVKQWSHQPK